MHQPQRSEHICYTATMTFYSHRNGRTTQEFFQSFFYRTWSSQGVGMCCTQIHPSLYLLHVLIFRLTCTRNLFIDVRQAVTHTQVAFYRTLHPRFRQSLHHGIVYGRLTGCHGIDIGSSTTYINSQQITTTCLSLCTLAQEFASMEYRQWSRNDFIRCHALKDIQAFRLDNA